MTKKFNLLKKYSFRRNEIKGDVWEALGESIFKFTCTVEDAARALYSIGAKMKSLDKEK